MATTWSMILLGVLFTGLPTIGVEGFVAVKLEHFNPAFQFGSSPALDFYALNGGAASSAAYGLPSQDVGFGSSSAWKREEFGGQLLGLPEPETARGQKSNLKHTRPKPHSIVPNTPAPQRKLCKHPQMRHPWHKLSHSERKHFIESQKCLMKLPARTKNPGVKTRWDDLTSVHQTQSDHIHFTGHFLPFHRLILHVHEHLLRTECGFKGTVPYWDETRDAGHFTRADIFDPDHGFGGNGRGSKHCVEDGPFAHFMLHLGPGKKVTNHCLSRKFSDKSSAEAVPEKVQRCLNLKRFDAAWPCIEGSPHTAGHFGVGGEMGNAVSSPGEPLFYLHHAFIDKIWWDWQKKDLDTRLREIAGFTTQKKPQHGWKTATLEDKLYLHGLMPDHTIAQIMDPMGAAGPLCYDYA